MARNYGKDGTGRGGGSDPGDLTQYKSEYDQMVVEHMSKGYSFASFGADINQSRETLYDWCDVHPSFKRAKQIGQLKAQKYLETLLAFKMAGRDVKGFDSKKSDTTLLQFALRTRCHRDFGDPDKNKDQNQNVVIPNIVVNIPSNGKEVRIDNPKIAKKPKGKNGKCY